MTSTSAPSASTFNNLTLSFISLSNLICFTRILDSTSNGSYSEESAPAEEIKNSVSFSMSPIAKLKTLQLEFVFFSIAANSAGDGSKPMYLCLEK